MRLANRLVPLALVVSAAILVVSHDRRARAQEQEALRGTDPPANAMWLDGLDLTRMVQRRGTPRAGRSGSGRGDAPLNLAGVVYTHGIGTLSINELIVDLKGQATRFVSMVGIDDAAKNGQGSVTVRGVGRQQEGMDQRCPQSRRSASCSSLST